MQTFQQQAEIIRHEQLGEDIFRITVRAPDIAEASRPGQFVMVRITDGMDPLLRRPFSVHQVSEGSMLQLLVKVVGRGTRALAGMSPGRNLDIVGPVGRAFDCGSGGNHVLVGGGIGIAPLLFLAKRLLRRNEPFALRVLLGARTAAEIGAVAEDFQSMGIAVDVTTEDGSLGRQGLVTDLMTGLGGGEPLMIYGCGPYPMLKAVAAICRERNWACQVSLETIMACGLAACLGCAVLRADLNGYVHVCKDGPVFDMDDVAWI